MGRLFFQTLDIQTETKCVCKTCSNVLCYMDLDIIRSDYQCQSGKALFAANVINVIEGNKMQKHFISGHYTIQDIYCKKCLTIIGWKYLEARE